MTDEEIKYILLNAKRLNIKECNARDLLFARYRELKELVDKQQKEIENLKLRKDNKVIINKIDQITKEYYELFNKKMSLESMNINGHRYNAMKMVLEELLSGQESDQEGGQEDE